MNNNLRYILYVRKSTDTEDKQAFSIEDQTKEMTAFAKRLGITITEIIEEAKSAKKPGREGFNRMLQMIEEGKADAILCWKLNRLARNPVDGGQISWLLQRDVIKHIQTHGSSYKPTDNVLMMAVELGMANQYVNDLSVDTKRGLRMKAERGWFPAATLPMGYWHNEDFQPGEMETKSDEERLPIVKKLWKTFLEGKSSVADIKRLGDTLGLRRPDGTMYSANSFRAMLNNEFYTGYFSWNDGVGNKVRHKGKHEAIVTMAEYEYAQILLGKHGKDTRIKSHDYALKGPVACGECGCRITAERKLQCICTKCKHKFSILNRTDCSRCGTDISEMKEPTIVDKTYYHCTKKRGPCTQKSIEENELSILINNELDKVEIPKDFYELALEAIRYLNKEEVYEQTEMSRINSKRETDLIKRSESYVRMRADGELSAEDFAKHKAEVERELLEVRGRQKNQHTRTIDWMDKADEYVNFAHKAVTVFATADNETKRGILASLGSNLTLNGQKLYFTMPKPLMGLRSMYQEYMSLSEGFEPKKTLANKGLFSEDDPQSEVVLRELDSNQ